MTTLASPTRADPGKLKKVVFVCSDETALAPHRAAGLGSAQVMGQRAIFLALAFLIGGPAPSLAQEAPLPLLRRLIAPPVAAITQAVSRPARAVAAGEVPLPRLRPTAGAAASAPATASPGPPVLSYLPDTDAAPTGSVPYPRLRPISPFAAMAALPSPALPAVTKPPPAAQSTCGVALAMLGVQSTPLAPVVDDGNCGIAAPVAIAALDDGAVAFATAAIVECNLAERLAEWTRDTLQPSATSILGERVTGLRVAASYACRNRNGRDDTELSEHAKGNALDVAAFRIGDRWIEVGSGWQAGGDDEAFLKAVRKSACGPFKTVLGPGSDTYHGDHFHLDLAKRRGGGTYCR